MADAIYPALHGRQHCPGGEDPIPCLSGGISSAAYIEFAFKTISDNATTNLTGGTVGQEVVKGTALTVDNTTGRITATEDGIYVAWLNVLWESSFTGYRLARITGLINQDQDQPYWDGQAEIGDVNGVGVDTINTSGIFFANFNGAGNNYFQAAVRQESGGALDVVVADFTVVQLAAITFP